MEITTGNDHCVIISCDYNTNEKFRGYINQICGAKLQWATAFIQDNISKGTPTNQLRHNQNITHKCSRVSTMTWNLGSSRKYWEIFQHLVRNFGNNWNLGRSRKYWKIFPTLGKKIWEQLKLRQIKEILRNISNTW